MSIFRLNGPLQGSKLKKLKGYKKKSVIGCKLIHNATNFAENT
jgi:hypothetical protein